MNPFKCPSCKIMHSRPNVKLIDGLTILECPSCKNQYQYINWGYIPYWPSYIKMVIDQGGINDNKR